MIRPVRSSDAESIARIYNHYIANTPVTFEEEQVSPTEINRRIDTLLASGLPWLVAEQNDELIGYSYAAQWHKRSAFRHSVEITAYLAPAATSLGWGTRLYTALFAELEHRPVHVVIGAIALPNEASIALHEKFAMQKVAHYKEVGFKFGEWVDVGYWQRILHHREIFNN